jgi:hypothetical protein
MAQDLESLVTTIISQVKLRQTNTLATLNRARARTNMRKTPGLKIRARAKEDLLESFLARLRAMAQARHHMAIPSNSPTADSLAMFNPVMVSLVMVRLWVVLNTISNPVGQ